MNFEFWSSFGDGGERKGQGGKLIIIGKTIIGISEFLAIVK